MISARGKMFSVGGDIAAHSNDRGISLPALNKALDGRSPRRDREDEADARACGGGRPGACGGRKRFAGGCRRSGRDAIGKSPRITSGFAKIGFSPDTGSTVTLTARMGPARAKRFFLLSETLDAAAAQSAGLVDIVVDDDGVLSEAERIGRELASGPTGSLWRSLKTAPRAGAEPRSFESQLERRSPDARCHIREPKTLRKVSRRFARSAARTFGGADVKRLLPACEIY